MTEQIGRPPGEPSPWGPTFWIVMAVLALGTFLCAWRVGS